MKICAMINRSAGNESVGDMWIETAVFDETATLTEVLKWADIIVDDFLGVRPNYRQNVRLAILQNGICYEN